MSLDPTPHTPPVTDEKPQRITLEDEQVFYEGFPRLRGELGLLFGWGTAGVALIALAVWLAWSDRIGNWTAAIAVLVGLVLVALPPLLVRRDRYKITNYRIDYEHGLLFKKYDTLELWHVEDISLRQSPIDRILQVGTIKIVSGDASTPMLELRSVPEPRRLLELVKQRVIAVKRQRGVVKLDM